MTGADRTAQDTMILAYLLGRPKLGLKELTGRTDDFDAGKNGRDLAQYAGEDAAGCLRLFNEYKETMTETQIMVRAGQMLNAFEVRKRANGQSFWCLQEGAPEWVLRAVRDAHSGMLPDDTRYALIREVLSGIAEQGDAYFPEPSIYTSDLLDWVASSLARVGYVDDACREYNIAQDATLTERLQAGQIHEMVEIRESLLDSLGAIQDSEEQA